MLLWRRSLRDPSQLGAAQPQQATALPDSATSTFQGEGHRHKAPVPWPCGLPLREQPTFQTLPAMQGLDRSKVFSLAKAKTSTHHSTKRSYAFHVLKVHQPD